MLLKSNYMPKIFKPHLKLNVNQQEPPAVLKFNYGKPEVMITEHHSLITL